MTSTTILTQRLCFPKCQHQIPVVLRRRKSQENHCRNKGAFRALSSISGAQAKEEHPSQNPHWGAPRLCLISDYSVGVVGVAATPYPNVSSSPCKILSVHWTFQLPRSMGLSCHIRAGWTTEFVGLRQFETSPALMGSTQQLWPCPRHEDGTLVGSRVQRELKIWSRWLAWFRICLMTTSHSELSSSLERL